MHALQGVWYGGFVSSREIVGKETIFHIKYDDGDEEDVLFPGPAAFAILSSLLSFFLLIAHACFLPTFSFQKVGLPDFTASTAELLRLRTFERTALASPRAGDRSASVAKTVGFKKPRTGALARRGKSKKNSMCVR